METIRARGPKKAIRVRATANDPTGRATRATTRKASPSRRTSRTDRTVRMARTMPIPTNQTWRNRRARVPILRTGRMMGRTSRRRMRTALRTAVRTDTATTTRRTRKVRRRRDMDPTGGAASHPRRTIPQATLRRASPLDAIRTARKGSRPVRLALRSCRMPQATRKARRPGRAGVARILAATESTILTVLPRENRSKTTRMPDPSPRAATMRRTVRRMTRPIPTTAPPHQAAGPR